MSGSDGYISNEVMTHQTDAFAILWDINSLVFIVYSIRCLLDPLSWACSCYQLSLSQGFIV